MRNLFNKQTEKRIIIQGLEAAGKTTLLNKWKLGEIVTTIPTLGFNVETLTYKNISMVMWDVGGRNKVCALYKHYYPNTDLLIFVVDSNDYERLDDVKYELQSVNKEDELKQSSFLILANKQDIASSYNPVQIAEALELHKVKQNCHILGISAITGEGLDDALEWITTTLTGYTMSKHPTEHSYSLKVWETMKKWFTT